MKIAITGSSGFIGSNLKSKLETISHLTLSHLSRNTEASLLKKTLNDVDVIIHLAGESRRRNDFDAFQNNLAFTKQITDLSSFETRILFFSTTKQNHQTYWQTKLQEEIMIKEKFKYHTIIRMDNVFGKWAKPDYNSVVATFIKRTILDEAIHVFNEEQPIDFLYIDDVIERIISCIFNPTASRLLIWKGDLQSNARLLLEMIQSIETDYQAGSLLVYQDSLKQKIATTYLTYLPRERLAIPSMVHADQRGNFIELTKGHLEGQSSVNIINSGYKKGEHFHHIRFEKFMFLSGDGVLRLRKKYHDEVYEFTAKDFTHQMITIPPGYIHEIVNTGKSEMIVWMWSSLVYDANSSDTYKEIV
jgi:UDP-2-acetamido-2,6-beta-L-arabino-hexul-4-ose reductase